MRPEARLTGAELTGLRRSIGLTPRECALVVQVPATHLDAMEAGVREVPPRVSRTLRSLAVTAAGVQALAEVGPCVEMETFLAMQAVTPESAAVGVVSAMERHTGSCALCQERELVSLPAQAAAARSRGWNLWTVMDGYDRIADWLGIPRDDAGKGRRFALMSAGVASAIALLPLFVLWSIGAALSLNDPMRLVFLALVAASYHVGFGIVGWAQDLTRPVGNRLWAYVVRMVMSGVGLAGSIGVVMALTDGNWDAVGFLACFAAAVGLVVGVIMWLSDYSRGTLPIPPKS